DLTTGFDLESKRWNPTLFQTKTKGINLYKLHGSLRWFGVRDTRMRSVEPQNPLVLMELDQAERQHLPGYLTVGWEKPELVLGPGSKVQADDPFFSLLYEFSISIKRAGVCVVIGYSYKDEHINAILDSALDGRISVLDVNPSHPNGRYIAEPGYEHLKLQAKDALVNGLISKKLAGY
ncbi:MAG: hypothetical protein ACREJN_04510, partial [Nitrospiraceae bacterium]